MIPDTGKKIKIAYFISVVGHPLLTFPVFAIIALFTFEQFNRALLHSSMILGGIFLPVAIKTYINSKNGTYTNFDVSNKTQRQSWYVFATLISLLVTIILFVTDQPRTISLSVLFAWILLFTSQLTNYFIKSSLHVSFNIFLSFLIIPMNLTLGIFCLFLTIIIAWARLTLQRHTMQEILTGSILGLIVGVLSLLYIH
jgi:hypothetical protein